MYRRFLLVLLFAFGMLAMAGWYMRTHWSQFVVLNPAGPVGLAERSVIFLTFALCAIVVLPVFGMLAFFAARYHAESDTMTREHLPDWDHTRGAEITTWLVPAAIILILAVVAWRSSHALDPYISLPGAKTLQVQVIALDWKWLFIYPGQGIATVNMLEIPEGVPVHFDITSDAPMNSFWIPQLGGQIMAMPGMQTQLNLMADRTGAFSGYSGNISGEGFSGMAFSVNAVSATDFNEWAASARDSGSAALTMDAYDTLAAPSKNVPVAEYSSVPDDVFGAALMKYMAPQSMPAMTP